METLEWKPGVEMPRLAASDNSLIKHTHTNTPDSLPSEVLPVSLSCLWPWIIVLSVFVSPVADSMPANSHRHTHTRTQTYTHMSNI